MKEQGRCVSCGKKRGKSKSERFCKSCHEVIKERERDRKRKAAR